MARDYNIARPAGTCSRCQRRMEPDEEFVATVVDSGGELHREDYCLGCYEASRARPAGETFGMWRTRVPRPQEMKRMFVDDALLMNFFERLGGAKEPAKVQLRFVLTLVLMRKKLLRYEGSRREDGREVWKVTLRGRDRTHEVVDPHMDEEKIAEVSEQLGQILEADL